VSALQLLEKNTQLDLHLASHDFAERLYARVQQLIEDGYPPAQVLEAVQELYRRAREDGLVVQRDAFVEVLDALDEEYPAS
jgi:hypothetical protein